MKDFKTYEEFKEAIQAVTDNYPQNWRKGQKIFNATEELLWRLTSHNIAREVQFEDHVDCFYNDNIIDEFLTKCWIRYNNYE